MVRSKTVARRVLRADDILAAYVENKKRKQVAKEDDPEDSKRQKLSQQQEAQQQESESNETEQPQSEDVVENNTTNDEFESTSDDTEESQYIGDDEQEHSGDDHEHLPVKRKHVKGISKHPQTTSEDEVKHNNTRGKRGFSCIQYRTNPSKFVKAVQKLSSEQKKDVVDMGLGSLLNFNLTGIPRFLGYWLAESFDANKCSLKMDDGTLVHIEEDDVLIGMGLPKGSLIIEIRRKSNKKRTKADEVHDNWVKRFTKMEHRILPRHVYNMLKKCRKGGPFFKRTFIVLFVTLLVEGNSNGTANLSLLRSLEDVDRIKDMNWCGYLLDSLVKTTNSWKKNPKGMFKGSLPFLTLFYVDRVVNGRRTVPRAFPSFVNWTRKEITKRELHEMNSGGFGMGYVDVRQTIPSTSELVFAEGSRSSQRAQGIGTKRLSRAAYFEKLANKAKEAATVLKELADMTYSTPKTYLVDEPMKSVHNTTVDLIVGKGVDDNNSNIEHLATHFDNIWSNSDDQFWNHPELIECMDKVEKAINAQSRVQRKFRFNRPSAADKVHNQDIPSFDLLPGIDLDLTVGEIARTYQSPTISVGDQGRQEQTNREGVAQEDQQNTTVEDIECDPMTFLQEGEGLMRMDDEEAGGVTEGPQNQTTSIEGNEGGITEMETEGEVREEPQHKTTNMEVDMTTVTEACNEKGNTVRAKEGKSVKVVDSQPEQQQHIEEVRKTVPKLRIYVGKTRKAQKAQNAIEEAEKAKKAAEEAENASKATAEAESNKKTMEEAKKAAQEEQKAKKAAEKEENKKKEAEKVKRAAAEKAKKSEEQEKAKKIAEELEKAKKAAEGAVQEANKATEEAEKAKEAEEAQKAKEVAEAEKAKKAKKLAEQAQKAKKANEEAQKAKEAAEAEKARKKAEQAEKDKKANEEAQKAKKADEEAQESKKTAEEAKVGSTMHSHIPTIINPTHKHTDEEKKIVRYITVTTKDIGEIMFQHESIIADLSDMRSIICESLVSINVINAWAVILNEREKYRSSKTTSRFFATPVTTAFSVVTPDTKSYKINLKRFTELLDSVQDMALHTALDRATLVFFPICASGHYYSLCFNLKRMHLEIIDNSSSGDKADDKYGEVPERLRKVYADYLRLKGSEALAKLIDGMPLELLKMKWRDSKNKLDCGVYLMRHMEAYNGEGSSGWECGFKKESRRNMLPLRTKYLAAILGSELNGIRATVIGEALKTPVT